MQFVTTGNLTPLAPRSPTGGRSTNYWAGVCAGSITGSIAHSETPDTHPSYWTYVSYKCGILQLDEIRSKLEQFLEWYDQPVSVERYEYMNNLFRIQPRPS